MHLLDRGFGHTGGCPADSFEGHAGQDQRSADDLEIMQLLGEQHDGEHDREYRLKVREESRTGCANTFDRCEPEDVGQEKRSDHAETQTEPGDPSENRAQSSQTEDCMCGEFPRELIGERCILPFLVTPCWVDDVIELARALDDTGGRITDGRLAC